MAIKFICDNPDCKKLAELESFCTELPRGWSRAYGKLACSTECLNAVCTAYSRENYERLMYLTKHTVKMLTRATNDLTAARAAMMNALEPHSDSEGPTFADEPELEGE